MSLRKPSKDQPESFEFNTSSLDSSKISVLEELSYFLKAIDLINFISSFVSLNLFPVE